SLLLGAVLGNNKDLRMPPGKTLEPRDIEHLAMWIKMGAPDPRTDSAPLPTAAPSYDWEKARQHWSFRPVADPARPRVGGAEWNHNPIDAFIKSKLDAQGLTPQPRATKLTLIRRATYDLTGLPPTPDAIDAFLKDQSPAA